MNKSLSLLSLCVKAQRLVCGFDAVIEAVENKSAKLVLIAQDISDKTRKNAEFMCDKYKVQYSYLPATIDEIWYSTGKKAGGTGGYGRGACRRYDQKPGASNNEEV